MRLIHHNDKNTVESAFINLSEVVDKGKDDRRFLIKNGIVDAIYQFY